MELHALSCSSGLASSNPDAIFYATDRLKEEHEQLREHLRILEVNAKEVMLLDDVGKCLQIVQQLKLWTAQFEEKLEQHSEWEEQELFPFLMAYFHRQPVPSIRPSFWVLEKDHQLGVSFIQSFNEAVLDMTPGVVRKRLVEAASYLLQGCLIMKDHITMEEQLILPLTERVLTDLDYFFS